MPIAFDAVSVANTNATSSTWAHTCTGSDRILYVGVGTDASGDVITGATYNGVSMTQVDKQQMASAATRFAYLFMLVNPASGANNIVVSANASHNIRTDAASYTGAKQTGQPDASNKGTTASTTEQSVAVTVVAAGSWIVAFGQAINAIPVAGTGLTSRGTEGINCRIGDSNTALSAGSNTISFTRGAADSINVIAASFSPAPDATGGDLSYSCFI